MGQRGKGEKQEWETSESNRSKTALNYLYTQLNAYVGTHLSIDTNTKYARAQKNVKLKRKHAVFQNRSKI